MPDMVNDKDLPELNPTVSPTLKRVFEPLVNVQQCQSCSAQFASDDAYQIHLGIGAPAFHRCDTSHEMRVKGMFTRPDGAWCIPPQFVTRSNNWSDLNKNELKRYFDAVKQEAKQYWSTSDEPVKMTDIWVSGTSCNDEVVDIDVSWVSESTKNDLRDDMLYCVSVLDDGSLRVDGPEW